MRAETSENEQARLAVLRGFGILDTPSEQSFDDITELTSEICDVPICLVSFVEDNRQWFKSKIGLDVSETPFEQSICAHAVFQNEFLEIQDTTLDPRTADNTLCMGDKPMRFYAGAVLRTSTGIPLGSLCVIDYKPRVLTKLQRKALQTHASHVVRLLELKVALETELALKPILAAKTDDLNAIKIELRSVLDTVPAMIWYKDDNNKILRLNKAAATSMGMAVEDVEGRCAYELFGDAAKDYHEADLKVFKSGVPTRGIIEPFTPNIGEQRWVQTDKIPFPDGVNGPRILVVATDITELKEQQAILKLVNENLDDFASLTSHDLQAPLRKIGISAELLQFELGDKISSEAKEYFSDISDGIGNMRNLIGNFLRFMRSSPDEVDLGPVDLTNVLSRVEIDQQSELNSAGGSLRLPQEQIYVRGDAPLLEQVFTNLINNAVKYRSEDRLLEVEITAKQEQLYWVISVSDNGSGIDPSFADQIFDLFGRAKPLSQIEGSGIGLALCRRIITLQGGTIELISKGQVGSTFEVKLFRARHSGVV